MVFPRRDDGCPQVTIRVSVEDKKLIKKFGGNYADIWRLGFEKWLENIPSELQKKADYYQNLLLQCNNKIVECNNTVITRECERWKLCDEIFNNLTNNPDFNIENPSDADQRRIALLLEKKKTRVTLEEFITHYQAEKQEGSS